MRWLKQVPQEHAQALPKCNSDYILKRGVDTEVGVDFEGPANKSTQTAVSKLAGSGTGIRTPTCWTKTSCPTLRRSPNIRNLASHQKLQLQHYTSLHAASDLLLLPFALFYQLPAYLLLKLRMKARM